MDKVILQWNCRSISNKKSDLIYLINQYNPFVIAISEIWLKSNSEFKLPTYSSLMNYRADGRAGCALFVRDHIPFSRLSIPFHSANLSAVCARVEGVTYLSLYIPSPTSSIFDELKLLIRSLPLPIMVLGDFNIHHHLWGCVKNDPLSNNLLEILDSNNLCLLNSGTPTLRPLPNQAPSAVDLSLCSPVLASQISWEVLNSSHGSDHFPIIMTLPIPLSKRPTVKPLLAYNINGADWDNYKTILNHQINDLPPVSPNSIQLCSDALISAINLTADKVFPLKNSAVGKIPSPPWWDKDCTKAVKERKMAEITYALCMSNENFEVLTKIMADTRSLLKTKKSDGWKTFCSSLSPATPDTLVWNNIRKFRRSFKPRCCPYPSSLSWAESFLSNLAPPFVPDVLDSPIGLLNNISSDPLDEAFTFQELLNVLGSVKDSTPGHDGITYSFISKAGEPFQKYLLDLYNCILLLGYPPPSWKRQLIMPILKPSKDPNDPRSYRPIALSSVVTKILEHLVKNRLEWFLESRDLLGASQFGFRKGKSTIDSLGIFTSDIRLSFTQGASVVAAFLDVEGAYDNVRLPILRQKFRKLNVPLRLATLIGNLLSERQITFRGKDSGVCPSRLIWRGLPQGSVLSPMLYNIYTHDLELSVTGCQVLQYADDILIYARDRSIELACETVNSSLESLNSWLSLNGLTLSPTKSCAVVFSRKRVLPPINLNINDLAIPVRSSYKFLGITLDTKLDGAEHFNYLVKKSERALNTLRCLSGVWWGAHPTSLRLLYNATVRSILDYGSFLLEPGNAQGLRSLDLIQYKALRIVLGAMRSSPTNALQVECVDPPLKLRRQFLADSYLYRAFQFSYHPLIHRLYDLKIATARNHKGPPCLVKSLINFQSIKDPVHHSPRLPLFQFSYESIIFRPRVILDFDICHKDPHADEYLRQILCREWHDWHTIYCDASKLSIEGCVGVGVVHTQFNIVQKVKCPPETSVYTGECIGILESVKYILLFKLKKTIIFSDSRSCLQVLLSNPFSSRVHNPIIFQIKHHLLTCKTKGFEVSIVWVPSHSGIGGNEKADQVAKDAVICGDKVPFKNYCHDLAPLASKALFKSWNTSWSKSSKKRGKHYYLVQPTIPRKPWFSKCFIRKEFCSPIIRMRLGHCCSPLHLSKMRIRDSSLCECGLDVGDLNHILLNCPLYINSELYKTLIKENIPLPTHSVELLQFKNKVIFEAIGALCSQHKI